MGVELAKVVVDRFRAELERRGCTDVPAVPALRAELEGVLTRARAEPAPYEVPAGRLLDRVAARLPTDRPALEVLSGLHAADVHLAAACALGTSPALVAFDAAYTKDLRHAYARARASRVTFDDFAQTLRQKLFSPPNPKIDDYSGVGPLRAWVRVVAARTLLDMTRLTRTAEQPLEDRQILGVPAPADAPDLLYLKRLYGAEVARAIQAAAKELSPEQRNLLRQHYAEGLSVDQIGRLRGVHKATAARRVQRARDDLLARVRHLLARNLKLSGKELESVLRLVQSQIHVTLERVLG